MKKKEIIEAEKGQRIDNIPDTGTQTGRYYIDFHGCWWEYIADSHNKKKWILGDYPQ
ncbi:hypothetical protein KAR91_51690 [Candidatus Pacearchaeota archaeon]|nr:hypothetical protein [Candidatus Pacearchaeota archaeon]